MRSNHPKSGNEMQPGAGRLGKNIQFWSNRASENSLHPGPDHGPMAKGPGRKLNHEASDDDYLPNVRRNV
jgi:hypothetical protein